MVFKESCMKTVFLQNSFLSACSNEPVVVEGLLGGIRLISVCRANVA